MSSARQLRWVIWPTTFVLMSWSLLVTPAPVLGTLPALWKTADTSESSALMLPRTRVQALELGWHAAMYFACMNDNRTFSGRKTSSSIADDKCYDHLAAASRASGYENRLVSPSQLTQPALRAWLALEDEERSVVQRVLGFFSFVNLVWLVAVIGVLCTIVPCIIYVFGERIAKLLTALYKKLMVPMHEHGVFEFAAYVLALLLVAQSCRYPRQHADAAIMVALTGAVGVLPCWLYSTHLWAPQSEGKKEEFGALTGMLLALILAPLALVHVSSLLGFFTVVAVFAACGFIMGPFFGGFYVGFRDLDALWRCLLVSAAFIVTFGAMHITGVLSSNLAPFAVGGRVLGSVSYFLALLICSSKWRNRTRLGLSYGVCNGMMLASVVASALVGSIFMLPSYTNTASTFFVLWIMEKELEIDWGGARIAVLFANFVVLYFIAHYLHTHPEIIISLFDPLA